MPADAFFDAHAPGDWLLAHAAAQPRAVVLANGFGQGQAFWATWRAWRNKHGQAQRGERLVYLALCAQLPKADTLRSAWRQGSTGSPQAEALLGLWPAATPDLHLIDLDGGRVRLLLAVGPPARLLPELVAQVHAFDLDAGDDAAPPGFWDRHRLRHLARLAAPEARLASRSAAHALQQALRQAGFVAEPGPAVAGTRARFAPRVPPQAPPGRRSQPLARRVAVVGAGLAGAGAARALAAQGLDVQVFEQGSSAAGQASGNPGGLFHAIVHGHESTHARWLRAAALHCASLLRPLVQPSPTGGPAAVPGAVHGLWRGERTLDPAAMQALLDRQALPPTLAQAHASAWPGGGPAWFYPSGGWVSPAALCRHWLAAPGITLRTQAPVHRLVRAGERWQLLRADGQLLAEADAVLLCNAEDAARLAHSATDAGPAVPAAAAPTAAPTASPTTSPTASPTATSNTATTAAATAAQQAPAVHPEPAAPASTAAATATHWPVWPLRQVRGQVTLVAASVAAIGPSQPLADGGYALRLPGDQWLCGATSQPDDSDPHLRRADHAINLATLQRLTGDGHGVDPATLGGRVGWRLQSDDRLPLVGAVPASDLPAAPGAAASSGAAKPRRLDQARLVPRVPGLYVFTALGSRGISQAALGGELLAAWLTGAPMPVPAALLDALDPARYIARATRRAEGPSPDPTPPTG